jgi:hypothetical protein
MAVIQEGVFKVTTVVDEDGHLSIFVQSTDGTEVIDLGEDIGNDDEFAVRLTTRKIEADYQEVSKSDPPVSVQNLSEVEQVSKDLAQELTAMKAVGMKVPNGAFVMARDLKEVESITDMKVSDAASYVIEVS